MDDVNERLAEGCRNHGDGMLIPFGTVHPKFPDWEEDLRRCDEMYHMPGIRLHPAYHNYKLDDPDFLRLIAMADERGLIVQIVGWMMDERHHNMLWRVPAADLSPLESVLRDHPNLRVVVINSLRTASPELTESLVKAGQVWFDFAKMDALPELNNLVDAVGAERVVFGTYAPVFIVESRMLTLMEAGLDENQERAILRENASRILTQA
jgi:predicted TIM-barrel fold metal-dependent hydrolase